MLCSGFDEAGCTDEGAPSSAKISTSSALKSGVIGWSKSMLSKYNYLDSLLKYCSFCIEHEDSNGGYFSFNRGIVIRAVVVVLALAVLSQVAVSAPSGIGKSANDGCLCHGDKDQSTTVKIEGLPESYESNTMYNFSITVESETVAANPNGSIGGFRMLVVGGSITFDESAGLIQELDGGWTHTESGNMVRSWNLSLVSPEDNASYVDFTVYGNAVNGNQASSEDAWNSLSLRLPGVEYDGEIFSDQADGFSPTDYTVGLVSMTALVGLLIITLRD